MKAFVVICVVLVACAAAEQARDKRQSVLPLGLGLGVHDVRTLGALGVDPLGLGWGNSLVDPLDVGLLNRVGGARSIDLLNRRLIDPIYSSVIDPITGQLIDPISGRLIHSVDARLGRNVWGTPASLLSRRW